MDGNGLFQTFEEACQGYYKVSQDAEIAEPSITNLWVKCKM